MNLASYAEFSRSVHERFADKRSALEVSIEVTHRCPLRCLHCHNNLSVGNYAVDRKELTKQEYFRLIDEIADLGCLWLLFTGGEIFVRKDFLEIYRYAKMKGFLITLFTNGILIDEKIADHLLEFPPFAIEITLYGRTKETYEALTGVPGSYERCLRAIELLRTRSLPLKLKTVVTSVNKHEILAMRNFAKEELGLDFKFDSLINPRLDCSLDPLAVRLTPEEAVTLDMSFPEISSEYLRLANRDLQGLPVANCETVYVCGGGLKSFAIDPYGHMSLCGLTQQKTYDLRSGTVKEGWEKFLLEVRNTRRKKFSKCVDCRLRSLCGMCPAYGQLENGDAEQPVEFLCEVAHLRAMALGIEVPNHGDCALCAGGSRHFEIKEKVSRIISQKHGVPMVQTLSNPLIQVGPVPANI